MNDTWSLLLEEISMGTRVHGYEYCIPVPIPGLPDGYNFFSFYKHMGIYFFPNPYPIGFLPAGSRVAGTHCHVEIRLVACRRIKLVRPREHFDTLYAKVMSIVLKMQR